MEATQYPNNKEKNQRYLRAKKRTDMLRKFYKHLMVYLVVNIIISGFKINHYMNQGDTFEEALFTLDTYLTWLIWGVFVLLQAIKTFKSNVILGADWEERKIREYMDGK
jgi:hypothetical protein